jgi:hypothetical protein
MNSKNEHESGAPEELDKVAEELESQADQRDGGRLESERDQQEDLNQGMQTGTHDAIHPGIKWGSSYTIKDTANPKKGFNLKQKESDGKS